MIDEKEVALINLIVAQRDYIKYLEEKVLGIENGRESND